MFGHLWKLSVLSVVAVVVGGAGCAAQEVDADPAEASDVGTTSEAMMVNCGTHCRPDLKFTKTTRMPAPSPGFGIPDLYDYVNFYFVNDSDVASGPFTAQIKNEKGNVVKVMHFTAGLAAHQTTSLCDVVLKSCGWKHTATVDVDGEVGEADETNNTMVYDNSCLGQQLPSGPVSMPGVPVAIP